MPQLQAILLACVAAMAVGCLIALQLTLSFRTDEELGLVASAMAAYLALATVAMAAVLHKSAGERALASCALVLAVASLLFSGWPVWMDAVEARSTNPFPGNHRDAQIVLEFLAPSLAGLIVLWRLLVRAHRKATDADPRTRWPWFTIAAGLLLVFNPLGIAVVGAALERSPADWFSGLWVAITAAAAATLIVCGTIEYALRARRLRLPVQAEV